MVNVQKIIHESAAGKGLDLQYDKAHQLFADGVAMQERDLDAQEQELNRQRTILTAPAFKTQRETLENHSAEVQRKIQQQSQANQLAFNDAFASLANTIRVIVATVAKEEGVTVVLPQDQVLYLGDDAIDITDTVLSRVDAKLPAISVVLPGDGPTGKAQMSDPRFFKANGPFTAAYLADFIQAELRGDGTIGVSDVSPLSVAGEGHLSFLDNRKYMSDFASTKAAVIIAAPHIVPSAPIAATLLIHKEPYKAYARIAQLFYPIVNAGPAAISAHAIIDPSATLGANCIVEAGAVISAGAKLGDNVHVAANAVIGVNVEIGDHSTVGIGASLTHCLVGQRVRILPGVRIGQEGFGFAIDPAGHIRIPQLGRVIIEDDVEIGANCTIDRGSGPDTIIGRGAMIDNLVQIAHNVVIGPGCVLVAQCGIAGSSHLGKGVVVGGQVGIAGHLKIGDGGADRWDKPG